MENKNTFFNKIKSIFSNLFKPKRVSLPMPKEESKSVIPSLKNQIEEANNKKLLAEKLLSGEVSSCELTDAEVDEMMEYFTKDIEAMDKELLRIKSSIVGVRKQLVI